jgi:peptidoglycan/LPS O-acetylase OafA/YrhL
MTTMHKKTESGRYTELDVFRGLAILAVLLFHYTTRYNQIYGHDEMPFALPYGFLGV